MTSNLLPGVGALPQRVADNPILLISRLAESSQQAVYVGQYRAILSDPPGVKQDTAEKTRGDGGVRRWDWDFWVVLGGAPW